MTAVYLLVIGVLCATAGTARLIYTDRVRYGPITVGSLRWRALQIERARQQAVEDQQIVTWQQIADTLSPDVIADIKEALR